MANLTIAGVNSSPYDIITLYIVNGERGYRIHNGTLSKDITEYIEKVKGDKDIQKFIGQLQKYGKTETQIVFSTPVKPRGIDVYASMSPEDVLNKSKNTSLYSYPL